MKTGHNITYGYDLERNEYFAEIELGDSSIIYLLLKSDNIFSIVLYGSIKGTFKVKINVVADVIIKAYLTLKEHIINSEHTKKSLENNMLENLLSLQDSDEEHIELRNYTESEMLLHDFLNLLIARKSTKKDTKKNIERDA